MLIKARERARAQAKTTSVTWRERLARRDFVRENNDLSIIRRRCPSFLNHCPLHRPRYRLYCRRPRDTAPSPFFCPRAFVSKCRATRGRANEKCPEDYEYKGRVELLFSRVNERESGRERCFSTSLIPTRRNTTRCARRNATRHVRVADIARGVITARDWRDIYAPISTSRLHVFDTAADNNTVVVVDGRKNSTVN